MYQPDGNLVWKTNLFPCQPLFTDAVFTNCSSGQICHSLTWAAVISTLNIKLRLMFCPIIQLKCKFTNTQENLPDFYLNYLLKYSELSVFLHRYVQTKEHWCETTSSSGFCLQPAGRDLHIQHLVQQRSSIMAKQLTSDRTVSVSIRVCIETVKPPY